MIVKKIDINNPDPTAIAEAAEALKENKIIVYPTETLYGIGGNALVEEVSRAINRAKGRSEYAPFIVLIPNSDPEKYIADFDRIRPIANKFWPGPLTILTNVVPGSLPANLVGPTGAYAFRVSSCPVATALIDACGFPITSTSVNITDREPMKKIDPSDKWLNSFCAVALDAGPLKDDIPSTLIDTRNFPEEIKILRGGAIPAGKLWKEFKGTKITAG